MLNSPVITVKHVGKKYKITHAKGGYITLRDVIATVFQNPFKFLKSKTKAVLGIGTEDFWALKDVNFEVKKGEIVGFLGPNGAGKSTTMKVLTGFMPATDGKVSVGGFDVFQNPIDVKRNIGFLPETDRKSTRLNSSH